MKAWALLATALFLTAVTSPVSANDYPDRTVTLVVPFSPGSAADNSMRVFTRILSQKLGQTVVIDNKPGAGGIIGMEYGANSKPDGYTLIFGSSGPMATYVSLYKTLSYDPVKSFKLVRVGAANPYVMVANPSRPYKTLAEFIDYARKNPDKINYGSPGSGTSNHLAAEMLQSMTGIKLTHVPYKSSTAQQADLLAGVLDVSFEFPSGSRANIEAGRLIPLAMASEKRMANFPNVPTFAELGYPDMKIAAWSSFVLPAGTPEPIVKKLDAAIAETLKDKAMTDYYAIGDSLVMDIGPDKYPEFLASEIARLKVVIERSGAKAN
ncbi:MAG: tripartite tricarboxylate transporter substrate binding protein [Xanthobacteraceae bacterium]